MATDYVELQADAKDIIAEFGVFGYIKLIRKNAVHDPVAGTMTENRESFDLMAVDLNIDQKLLLNAGENTAGESRVLITDRMVIMSSDVEPKQNDIIQIGTKEHTIVRRPKVSPAGTDVYYKVICRA